MVTDAAVLEWAETLADYTGKVMVPGAVRVWRDGLDALGLDDTTLAEGLRDVLPTWTNHYWPAPILIAQAVRRRHPPAALTTPTPDATPRLAAQAGRALVKQYRDEHRGSYQRIRAAATKYVETRTGRPESTWTAFHSGMRDGEILARVLHALTTPADAERSA